jgi:tRNA (mo5U34)-methyltransferase
VEPEELRRRISAFPRWHYRFEFANGVSTPVSDRARINRERQRYAYFFERLLAATGGSLRGRRVLDLGCNAGFWSLAAHDAGADFVMGIDLKEEYIEQARLVFEAREVDPSAYQFHQGDVFTQQVGGDFDVVLCLGLMDQVDRPVELFQLMAGTAAELIVIDSKVSRAHSSLFELTRLYSTRDVLGDGLALTPSRQAVADLANRHGYQTVALALEMTDPAGMSDYRRERRCAFICSSRRSLSDLPVERRPRLVPWWVRDPRALAGA